MLHNKNLIFSKRCDLPITPFCFLNENRPNQFTDNMDSNMAEHRVMSSALSVKSSEYQFEALTQGGVQKIRKFIYL